MAYEKFSDRFRTLGAPGREKRATPEVLEAATPYQKFSDRFKNSVSACAPATVATVATVEPESAISATPQNQPTETVAGIATVAGAHLQTEFFAARSSTDPKEWQRSIASLDIDHPPEDVPFRRWQTFVSGAARFLAGPFAEQAAALGWTALDLFGCDDRKPFARIDQMGLVWFVAGHRIVMISESAAVLETATGSRQTYRRRPAGPGRVLVWEITR
jgi:hypothetical protein